MDILKNKVAVITGGNGVLGRALVKAFSKAGSKIVISDMKRIERDFLDELDQLQCDYITVQCDITDSEQVQHLFSTTIDQYGTVDILLNNAGKVPTDEKSTKYKQEYLELKTKPVKRHGLTVTANITDEEWKSFFDVNIHGAFYCTREALKIMQDKKTGCIINITSVAGISSEGPYAPHYSASKAALVGFTKAVAAEVAGDGIRVNAIAAGSIATPVYEKMFREMTDEEKDAFFQLIPSGRIGSPEEYASTAVWLASEMGSYVIGQIINQTGGWII